jgi:hypothetical protein
MSMISNDAPYFLPYFHVAFCYCRVFTSLEGMGRKQCKKKNTGYYYLQGTFCPIKTAVVESKPIVLLCFSSFVFLSVIYISYSWQFLCLSQLFDALFLSSSSSFISDFSSFALDTLARTLKRTLSRCAPYNAMYTHTHTYLLFSVSFTCHWFISQSVWKRRCLRTPVFYSTIRYWSNMGDLLYSPHNRGIMERCI